MWCVLILMLCVDTDVVWCVLKGGIACTVCLPGVSSEEARGGDWAPSLTQATDFRAPSFFSGAFIFRLLPRFQGLWGRTALCHLHTRRDADLQRSVPAVVSPAHRRGCPVRGCPVWGCPVW
ncbi:hypothetical protein ACOMHN_046940 [Nucella lapillus]